MGCLAGGWTGGGGLVAGSDGAASVVGGIDVVGTGGGAGECGVGCLENSLGRTVGVLW